MGAPRTVLDSSALRTELARRGVVVERLTVDATGTIRDVETIAARTSDATPVSLPVLTGPTGDIVVLGELSAGGMGTVLIAEQSSLGREVAVKKSTTGRGELVVEARVAGLLEHPNIVPIYMLGTTPDGEALLVMKRIEGRSWRDMIHDEGRDLARDIDILMQVCRALHFAHTRGVLHRDVKPSNVMVGTFGEVYLVDWGIAVGFGDRAPAGLPHVRDLRTVAGTPAFMAPEMVLLDEIDQRTDVYIVGAVLFSLVTGTPPHARSDILAALCAAHAARPGPLDDAPEELVAICRRAMARELEERYASVEELREALATYQSHAAARVMCDGGEERLARLTALRDVDGTEAQRLFTEARFSFTQALRVWPGSARAREGLERVVALMVRRELAADRLDAAEILARDLDTVPADLAAELNEARKRRASAAANVDELVRFARDRDLQTGQRERGLIMFGTAAVWLGFMVTLQVLKSRGIFVASGGTFVLAIGGVVLALVVAALRWPGLRSTTAARALHNAMLGTALASMTLHAVAFWYDVPGPESGVFSHVLLAGAVSIIAAQDRRVWASAAVLALVIPLVMVFPEQHYIVSGAGTASAFVLAYLRWRPSPAP